MSVGIFIAVQSEVIAPHLFPRIFLGAVCQTPIAFIDLVKAGSVPTAKANHCMYAFFVAFVDRLVSYAVIGGVELAFRCACDSDRPLHTEACGRRIDNLDTVRHHTTQHYITNTPRQRRLRSRRCRSGRFNNICGRRKLYGVYKM